MNNNILFSFIIPHHNIPALLVRCIESIPNRNNIEIIVVDDNSDLDIITELSNLEDKYENLTLYRTHENRGAGYARNMGLRAAKGKWLLFTDADDFFYPCINNIIDKYSSSNYDIIYFLSNSRFSNNLQKMANKAEPMMEVIDIYRKCPDKNEQFLRFKYAVPWGKIIRNSFIKEKGIVFDEVLAGNDVLFSAKSGYYASNIVVEESYAYCVTEREGSIVKTENSLYVNQRIESRIHLMQFLRSIGYTQYRHPIGELVFYYRKDGLRKSINTINYIIKQGYGFYYLMMDLFKFVIYYLIRKIKHVYTK